MRVRVKWCRKFVDDGRRFLCARQAGRNGDGLPATGRVHALLHPEMGGGISMPYWTPIATILYTSSWSSQMSGLPSSSTGLPTSSKILLGTQQQLMRNLTRRRVRASFVGLLRVNPTLTKPLPKPRRLTSVGFVGFSRGREATKRK